MDVKNEETYVKNNQEVIPNENQKENPPHDLKDETTNGPDNNDTNVPSTPPQESLEPKPSISSIEKSETLIPREKSSINQIVEDVTDDKKPQFIIGGVSKNPATQPSFAMILNDSSSFAKVPNQGSVVRIYNTDSETKRKSRMSKAKMITGSVMSIKRGTSQMEYSEKSKPCYGNTYKLEPDHPFNAYKVRKILKMVMKNTFEEIATSVGHYISKNCEHLAVKASNEIRTKIKQLEYERYKLICLVTIGEKNFQDMICTNQCLWDSERDRCSFYTIENSYLFGIAQCFGLYFE